MQYLKTLIVLTLAIVLTACGSSRGDWRTASRASAGIAPDASTTEEAVIHVYGADTVGWRGNFAIHTWIAAKRSGENFYTIYDVVGWRARWGGNTVRVFQDIPDRHWYGARPELIQAHQGEGVDEMIDAIEMAVIDYPWQNVYKAFPGPNSNTFIAWIGRKVPSLELDLPFAAIGSSYAYREG